MPVTAATPNNIVIGAGEVYVDTTGGGATTDNNVFRVVHDMFVPELNGTKGALIGTDYITNETAEMEVTLVEISAATIDLMIPGATTTGGTLSSDDTRRVGSTSYHDYELRVPRYSGGNFSFQVDNAINTGNAEYEAADDGMLAPRITVQGRWDPAALNVGPWRIVITAS